MSSLNIQVKLFGSFRKFGDDVNLSVNEGSTIAAIKVLLAEVLGHEAQALIADSVIANDDEILDDAFVVSKAEKFSILPPVCGG